MDALVIACVPAKEEDRHGIPYNPPHLDEFEVTQCESCNLDVLIGPASRQKRVQLNAAVLCMKCAIILTGGQPNVIPLTDK